MSLVREWTGQVARAAGASLLFPLVLLLASSVVASGGGLGSFDALQEIASGPPVPDIGLAAAPGAALENAEIVGADPSPPADSSRPPAAAPGALASTTPATPARAASTGSAGTPVSPGGQAPGGTAEPRPPVATPGDGVTAPAPPKARPAPVAPGPVDGLLDATRDLGDTLRAPLEPLTDTLLNLLRGPPSR